MKLFFSARKRFLAALFLVQVSSLVAAIYAPRLIGQFIDAVFGGASLATSSIFLAVFVGLMIGFCITRFVTHYFFHQVLFDIRLKLLTQKLQTSKPFATAHNEARIYVYDYIFALFGVAWVVVSLVATIAIVALSSWILAGVILFIFVFSYLVPKIFALRLATLKEQQLGAGNRLTATLNKLEHNAPTISLGGAEMSALTADDSSALAAIATRMKRLEAVRNAFTSVVILLVSLGVLLAAALLIYFDLTSIGNLLVASTLSISLTEQVPGLTSDLADLRNNHWITKVKDEVDQAYVDALPPAETISTVRIRKLAKKVSLRMIFSSQSLNLRGSASLLIQGPNEEGKSTLARIIAGLDLNHQGAIFFNNRLQGPYVVESVIYQASTTSLIAGTVRANITAFAYGVNEARLAEVASALQISHLIEREIINLSAGEAALVKIAAMLYVPVGVRIYDEVFANLDARRWDAVIAYALSYPGVSIVIAHHAIAHEFTHVLALSNQRSML